MEKIINELKYKYGGSYRSLSKALSITDRQLYNLRHGKASIILENYVKLIYYMVMDMNTDPIVLLQREPQVPYKPY